MAALHENGEWQVCTVATTWLGTHRLLSVGRNLSAIHDIATKAGGMDRVVVAFERSRKNPRFGTKNNYVNGRNEEFWRVVLLFLQARFCSVDPKTWQSLCFPGAEGARTKDRARSYVDRHCPGTGWLDDFNKAPREAIVDAMCIALWCRAQYNDPEAQGIFSGEGASEVSAVLSFPPGALSA